MLARPARLNRARDIELVHKKGRKIANRYFRIKYRPNGLKHSRATVVVSQKVARLAVTRNRLKRIIRPVLNELLPKDKPLDLLVIAQPSATRLNSAEARTRLTSLFKKIL